MMAQIASCIAAGMLIVFAVGAGGAAAEMPHGSDERRIYFALGVVIGLLALLLVEFV